MKSAISVFVGRITERPWTILPILVLTFVLALLVVPISHGQAQHSITIAWMASTTPNVTYNVYRASAAGGPYTKLNATPLSSLSYVDTTGVGGTKYYYVVRAFDGAVESVNSAEVSATFLAAPQPPLGVTATAN